jgi:uncharacterized protein (DUF1330 family)
MTAYAIAHVREVFDPSPEIVEYLRLVNETMDPFGGRFLVHDAPVEVMEGEWPGGFILIEFPDMDSVHAWYDSAAYRKILSYRTDHIRMDIIFVDCVPAGYRSEDAIAKLPPM